MIEQLVAISEDFHKMNSEGLPSYSVNAAIDAIYRILGSSVELRI